MPEVDRQVLGFVNPFVGPDDDEDDDIFKPERSFFNLLTFVSQWCVKKIKMHLCLHSGSIFSLKLMKCWKLINIKKINFQPYHEIKMSRIAANAAKCSI